ncbi:hypothetical protein GCM10022223_62950 [Kineosporia mesophila]|uniref:Uncharacterized protein n=1 Tax=Kineosporia mesophila TaxID=566012 RepID=A0ABP7AN03_9ACTN|nr:hypothetical protein [Kineosporia mesophila]MCD5354561.1 hypothetical protein [Kineosporia mesophila]
MRILTPLLDNDPRAGGVMFVPGTRMVVLDTRLGGQSGLDLVFLQEVPANAPNAGPAHERTLEKLRDAIDSASLLPSGGRTVWPPYALGLLGGETFVGAATTNQN